MPKKRIEVQLSSPERYFSRCYHDFMDCTLLTGEEKIVFLSLKRFLDVKSDDGKVFPSIEAIQKMTGWGNQKVIKHIKGLVKKGVVKSIRRGLSKPNLYILSDYPTMWACESVEEMAKTADNKGEPPMTAEEHIAELRRMGYEVEIKKKTKEKGIVPDSDQTTDTNPQKYVHNDNTTAEPESQEDSDADMLLDRLWKLYPVKKGKGRISAAQRKKLLKIGYDKMSRAIERYKQYVENSDYIHYQYGSTFFNGGYVDYLDENYEPEDEPRKRGKQKNTFNDYPHRQYDFDAIRRNMFNQ